MMATNFQDKQAPGYDFICYGEILWDILPGGAKPGGAPMNVAYHLKNLGHEPAVITRVGKDENGSKLLKILNQKNIGVSHVQQDEDVNTGIVHASPNEQGEMSYDIVAPAAWDNIEWHDDLTHLFDDQNYLVFGSLICRNTLSRGTLYQLIDCAKNKVLDINLRPPHYNRELIVDLLQKADVAKLNKAELELISGWNANYNDTKDQVQHVQDTYKLKSVIVTLGGDGALMNMQGQTFFHPGYHIVVEDTVGSGDAFLAGMLSKLMRKENPQKCLEFACAIGALVTSKKGAWPEYDVSEIKKLKEKENHPR